MAQVFLKTTDTVNVVVPLAAVIAVSVVVVA